VSDSRHVFDIQEGHDGKEALPRIRSSRSCMFSQRRACAALGQHRSTQCKVPRGRDDEQRLTADIIELARQYGRYGYRKIAGLLRQAGWAINNSGLSASGDARGSKSPASSPSAAGFGGFTINTNLYKASFNIWFGA
jgi:hypothetical protein